ncbi:uncharacterized protein zgc:194930 [Nerophis ophidion]|uniref:uncharacterized protein zgc:194930 n=1 Tax=Nerophis ophidion TaxID=159077 RepID=UPI002ADF0387|nr:uncharacterized protein zgc:194930 [Nerophis ophidion]XP_061769744.1 uncharacterized protein zgc:194930 [Nerophis ophidion]
MGCHCCRMMKSYMSDPSVAADVSKTDSLYRTHSLSGGDIGGRRSQIEDKEGFHNLAYSISSDSSLRLEVDNNHVNHRLHAAPPPALASAPPAEGALYIIQPDALGPQWVIRDTRHSQVPVYNHKVFGELRHWDSVNAGGSLSADEVDEGVGGTPEYPCDTGDEGSVLSVDIQTSTASLSSGDTKYERKCKAADVSTVESGICVTKSEDEVQSVMDSMVAEALAALEAATAGEDCE